MAQGLKFGQTLQNGKYRIEKVLGQGSFGITYLATAKFITEGNLGKMDVEAKVAIKEFFMSEVNGRNEDGSTVEGSTGSVFSNYRKKFKREAENLSKLSHPNIVKVFDVFDENSTTYYVMEFLEGTNLDDYIIQNGGLSEDKAISIVREVGKALAYMHSQKMLHLDIKPKNIMRKHDGKYYLIDFGLSKQFTEDGEPESSTSIGAGTPGYAPIEQFGFKQDGSFPATLDIYALGATMFKMLTGKRPPEATNILNEGFPDIELSMSDVSEHTLYAVKKAMKPVKKERYQCVNAFLRELWSIQKNGNDDGTLIGSSHVEPEPPRKSLPKPKHKWIWYVTTAIIFIVAIAIWRSNANQASLQNHQTTADEEQTPSHHVINMDWDSPLGKAIYTGHVVPDSIYGNAKLLPHGRGNAKIVDGQYSGSTYDGDFLYGKMEGEAVYTYKNGDIFNGIFLQNQYYIGKYIIRSTGEYFNGTFKDGNPYDGSWYDRNDNFLQKIVDGK